MALLTQQDLIKKLTKIDRKGYGAYKGLKGLYKYDKFTLFIDHVQSDPFATPSKIRVRVGMDMAKIPSHLYRTKARKIALEDFFTRHISSNIQRVSSRVSGTGKSGLISIISFGQEVLERTSVVINKEFIEARISIGLPARGRTVLAKEAQKMLTIQLENIIYNSMLFSSINQVHVKKHVELIEDQEALRCQLEEKGLVAFIANGSVLPRESGISDKPLQGKLLVKFQTPKRLEISFELPNVGVIKGMGIAKGITLIVGGGYHGKSTLLKAIERGVYNHVPGDGREYVITVKNAVKIRAEDSRFVENIDISPFINNLPTKQDTRHFTTLNGSGSTSQAANISEAIEAGTQLLLLDEDTCATNFMIRDARMQRLVQNDKEPITPFIDRVKLLYDQLGLSTILVIGGAGDYFDVADTAILMDAYHPKDVTDEIKEIVEELPAQRVKEKENSMVISTDRIPLPSSFDIKGRKEKVKSKGKSSIIYGNNEIALHNVEQLVDASQTVAIGLIIKYIKNNYVNGVDSLAEILRKAYSDIEKNGLDVIAPFEGQHPGDYAMPRLQETFAAINRLRTLKIKSNL